MGVNIAHLLYNIDGEIRKIKGLRLGVYLIDLHLI